MSTNTSEALTSIAQTALRLELAKSGKRIPDPGDIARHVTASARLVGADDGNEVVAIAELSRRFGVGNAASDRYEW